MWTQLKKIFSLVVFPIGSIVVGVWFAAMWGVTIMMSPRHIPFGGLWILFLLLIAIIPFIFLIKRIFSQLKLVH